MMFGLLAVIITFLAYDFYKNSDMTKSENKLYLSLMITIIIMDIIAMFC